jgi:hypothetical protein
MPGFRQLAAGYQFVITPQSGNIRFFNPDFVASLMHYRLPLKGALMKTSEDAKKSGLYESDCCSQELIFLKDDTLWRCPRCHGLCQWELVTTIDVVAGNTRCA